MLHVDHAQHFQRHQSLRQRCPRDTHPLGQIPFGGQQVTRSQPGGRDETQQLFHEPLIQPGT